MNYETEGWNMLGKKGVMIHFFEKGYTYPICGVTATVGRRNDDDFTQYFLDTLPLANFCWRCRRYKKPHD